MVDELELDSAGETTVEKQPEAAAARAALEARVTGEIATFVTSNDADDADDDDAAALAELPDVSEIDAAVAAADADVAVVTDDETEAADEEAVTDEVSTLPAAYRRSLKARQWEDDEIDAFWKEKPDLAMKTFERIHESRREEIARFADLGRQQRQTQLPAGSPAPALESAPDPQVPGGLQEIDRAALIEQVANEELVNALVNPVNATIRQINEMLPEMRRGVASSERARKETLSQQIEVFFTGKDLVPYKELYGSAASLTNEQVEHRQKVLETADAIVAGATLQHRDLSVSEALLMAHDAESADFRDTAVRAELKKTVKTRAKGKSLPPSHRTPKANADGRARTRKQLEARAETQLAKVFRSER